MKQSILSFLVFLTIVSTAFPQSKTIGIDTPKRTIEQLGGGR
jgi:hypothetical protein